MFYTVKTIAILIAVAAAGYSSYHIVELGLTYSLGVFAFVMPLFIDGLAIIATLARGNDRFPAIAQRAATKVLAGAGVVSIAANLAAGHNIGQRFAGVVAVGAYVVAEWFVSQMAHRVAVAMVAKTDADAALATAMATAAADMAAAILATERRLQTEAAELVAEAERATRQAVAAEHEAKQMEARKAADATAAARADAERIARDKATAERLANLEAERQAMAKQLANATAKPVAKPATVATPRVANGQASATVMAILATDADMATDAVIAAAMAQGVEVSSRTVRRVKLEMRMATAAA